MCRNRTERIEYIQKNLIVYIYRRDKTDNYISVGTGFLISNDGTVMTAKHNIDFSLSCSFWAYYKGNYYEIRKKQNLNYQYIDVDIIMVQSNIKLNLNPCDFFCDYTLKEETLISEEVVVIGYENKKNELLCTTGIICGVNEGKYEIQNANIGNGNSGAPVVLKRDLKTLIGVMSKRESLLLDIERYKIVSDRFGIGYAHSIGLYNQICGVTISYNNIVCNLLNTRELSKWEDYFICHIKKINDEYKRRPNPIYVYTTYFKNYQIETVKIEKFCEFLISNRLFLYSVGRLYELIGNILINSGISTMMPEVRYYLNISNLIYENQNVYIEEVIRKRIRVNWLISISYKLEKNLGEAVKVCDDIVHEFTNECEKLGIDYGSSLILPEREIAVIEQQKWYFRTLKQKSHLYETNALENFFTNRRIFEYLLHRNNINEAKKIIQSLIQSYETCKHQLEPIYKFALAKNLYQYYMLLNQGKKAGKYYGYAMKNFKRWGLKGQQEAILKLQDNLS